MGETIRFGISIDDKLLDSFDHLIELKGYMNRSEAIRDLIRAALVELKWEGGEEETVGTVTLVYNHHVRDPLHIAVLKFYRDHPHENYA